VALNHAQGVALDLSRQANGDMTLELEYQVVAVAPDNAKVTVGMNCGENCKATLDFSSYFSGMSGKGWQSLKIPLRCFSQANTAFDLTKISQPLVLEATSGFKLQLAKVRLAENEGQGQCGN
jgi:beta-glucosidase